jgi:hypothetical protein
LGTIWAVLGSLEPLGGYTVYGWVMNSKDAKDAKTLGKNLESRIQNPEYRSQKTEDRRQCPVLI